MENNIKYFVTQIADGDDKIKGKSIYEYDTLDKAEANYHQKVGVAMASELYTEFTCYVTNSLGGFYQNLSKHYVGQVEPTENAENAEDSENAESVAAYTEY